MSLDGDFLMQVGSMLITVAVSYGAIRSDIKNIHQNVKDNYDYIRNAHQRIDNLLISLQEKDK